MDDISLYFTAATGDDVTASASGELFTQSIPLLSARNISIAKGKLYVVATVMQALVGGGDSVDLDLITTSDAALSQNLTVITQAIVSFPAASAVGTKLFALVPESTYNSSTFLAENLYLGLRAYARGSGAPSQGLIKACLSLEPAIKHIYASATQV
jgi:hypothetical protein